MPLPPILFQLRNAFQLGLILSRTNSQCNLCSSCRSDMHTFSVRSVYLERYLYILFIWHINVCIPAATHSSFPLILECVHNWGKNYHLQWSYMGVIATSWSGTVGKHRTAMYVQTAVSHLHKLERGQQALHVARIFVGKNLL